MTENESEIDKRNFLKWVNSPATNYDIDEDEYKVPKKPTKKTPSKGESQNDWSAWIVGALGIFCFVISVVVYKYFKK